MLRKGSLLHRSRSAALSWHERERHSINPVAGTSEFFSGGGSGEDSSVIKRTVFMVLWTIKGPSYDCSQGTLYVLDPAL